MSELELELMKTKFWDYRLVSPDVATMIFTHRMAIRLSAHNEWHGESKHKDVLKGFNIEAYQEWKNWPLMERARRWCDEVGMNYDKFWIWATEEHEKLGWKRYMGVFCGQKIFHKVLKRHETHSQNFIVTSSHPFFLAEGYRGCKLQKAYYRNIVMQVYRKYRSKSPEVMKTMLNDGVVAEDYFLCR